MSKKAHTLSLHASWLLAVAVVATAVVIAGGIYYSFYARRGATLAPSQSDNVSGMPQLVITPEAQDLGTIDYRKGIVTAHFIVENKGGSDLVITEMETSCGCTVASLIVNGEEGPRFGMRGHGAWPTGWSAKLKPGEQAQLKVAYDPNAHGIYVGSFDRIVLIRSNDPEWPTKRLRIFGYQKGG
jgi:hypothetical protein